MNRTTTRLLTLALCVLAPGCSEPAGVQVEEEPESTAPRQLLLNGDVEGGASTPASWESYTSEPAAYGFEWSSDAASGVRSLSVRAASTAAPGAYWHQSLPISNPSGVMFLLTAMVKVNDVAGRGVSIAVRGDDTSLNNGRAEAFATTQSLQLITGTTGWRRIRVGLTGVPPSVDQLRVFLIHLPGTSGEVLFDDISLEVLEQEASATARQYMEAVLDIMEVNSINRYVIDWRDFRARARSDVAGAETTADVYPAIDRAIERLEDNHSFLRRPPLGTTAPAPLPPPALPAPPARADPGVALLAAGLGYLEVPAFTGLGAEANALATQYHRLIESVDTLGICGWVVDLRGNTGGNMWPMIAGVGPILGEGLVGHFVDPDSVVSPWYYRAGGSWNGSFEISTASNPYTLLTPTPPVAVLTDGLTASSGEATTIAFRGRPDARSFGEPTWGVSTANRGFPLSDGAMLILTVSTMADRTGQLYGLEVVPDETVAGAKTGDPATDAPLRTAMDWLRAHPGCSAP